MGGDAGMGGFCSGNAGCEPLFWAFEFLRAAVERLLAASAVEWEVVECFLRVFLFDL